jgi:hypothetical protein
MSRSTADILDEGGIGKIPPAMATGRVGTILKGQRQYFRGTVTAGILTLPTPAAVILRAIATAGTTLGPKTPVIPAAGATGVPATTQVTISPTGNASFNVSTDALTAAEVEYLAETGQVFSEVLAVASNTGVPLASKNVIRLLSATSLAGTLVGALVVDQRGTAPATGHAAAKADGTGFAFNSSDAVTSVSVTYVATPGVGTAKGDPVAALAVSDKNW